MSVPLAATCFYLSGEPFVPMAPGKRTVSPCDSFIVFFMLLARLSKHFEPIKRSDQIFTRNQSVVSCWTRRSIWYIKNALKYSLWSRWKEMPREIVCKIVQTRWLGRVFIKKGSTKENRIQMTDGGKRVNVTYRAGDKPNFVKEILRRQESPSSFKKIPKTKII